MAGKQQIRGGLKEKRNALTQEQREEYSGRICENLLECIRSEEPDFIFFYYPLGSEVNLLPLAERLLKEGKKIAFPKTNGESMEFYRVTSLSDFKEGAFHIMEPIENVPLREENAFVLVPGLGFDKKGNRLGYGKGFYDRYFARFPACRKIGVAYETQILPEIPAGEYDIPMELVVTEIGMNTGGSVMNSSLEEIGKKAREAESVLRVLSVKEKNKVLSTAADYLMADMKLLLEANARDMEKAKENNMPPALQDRLQLTEARIAQMAEGLRQIAALDDPVGEVLSMKQRPNGLVIGQKRVPLGVIGIIYESRPNVTADAFGLCFKAGNVVILRGGKDSIHSNNAITKTIQEALRKCELPIYAIQLITDTSHETAEEFMRMNEYVDVLIPRGGAGLIRTVVQKATVPVIETGTGNCHIFVDESADLDMALDIIFNAKTQRIGVCNACESLVVHEKIKDVFLPKLAERLNKKNVELRGDEKSRAACSEIKAATEEDWGTEYLDYILSIKTVSSIEEAIAHINKYNTGHSEAIITKDYANSQKFLNEIDAAAVYVNASTRFTDGFEFGFGAEIGISTQKLHARGPMGLKELTTTKYIIYGNGQIRK